MSACRTPDKPAFGRSVNAPIEYNKKIKGWYGGRKKDLSRKKKIRKRIFVEDASRKWS